MSTQDIIAIFSKKFVDNLIEDNFFDVKTVEDTFDMKRVEKKEFMKGENECGEESETCMLCLGSVDEELIAYKCKYCSCHLHHSCLNNYAKIYTMTNCIQCKHMHSSVFTNMDFWFSLFDWFLLLILITYFCFFLLNKIEFHIR